VEAHGLRGDIVPVTVTQVAADDPDATHWGWITADGDLQPALIWPTRAQYDVCFTYGPAAEQDAGKGRTVRLRIVPDIPEGKRPRP
jgi:hypothetical protein